MVSYLSDIINDVYVIIYCLLLSFGRINYVSFWTKERIR